MPRFAANLSMMFTEYDFLDRFRAAAEAGFRAVEFLFPYAYDPHLISSLLNENSLVQVLFNMPPGDWEAGDRGLGALPDRSDEFRASVGETLHHASVIGCTKVHLMAGICPDDPEHHETYVANVRYAARELAPHGIKVLLEPLNPHSTPGYFLSSVHQAIEVITEIDEPNVALQYDLFHAQQTDGDITNLTARVAPLIGHVQIASVPDRHEPDHGELHHPWVLAELDRHYDGWVGCEYTPADDTLVGLGWLAAYR